MCPRFEAGVPVTPLCLSWKEQSPEYRRCCWEGVGVKGGYKGKVGASSSSNGKDPKVRVRAG